MTMACNRGKASPDSHTKVRLFADSGGYCQNPECTRLLFMEIGDERIHVAEIAHIFAAGDDGPRANQALTPEQKGAYENLILLCPTCHTMVDKAPAAFPDSLVIRWKRQHVEKLAAMFGARRYPDRLGARSAILPLLDENQAIHREYGPDNEYRLNPESEQSRVWQRKVRSRILPNNRRILALLDANRELLSAPEQVIVELLRQHVDDLEARHIDADHGGGGARFPAEAHTLLRDVDDNGRQE
jgi:hypothetical protein